MSDLLSAAKLCIVVQLEVHSYSWGGYMSKDTPLERPLTTFYNCARSSTALHDISGCLRQLDSTRLLMGSCPAMEWGVSSLKKKWE